MTRGSMACCIALVALLGHGCGSPLENGSAPENRLHRGNEAEPESLDPHAARSVAALNVSRDLGEGLVTLDADGDLAPGAAGSWSVSDDGLHYRFQLRRDGRWSNGDALTAADFVAGFRRLLDPATGAFYGDLLSPIAGAADVLRGQMVADGLAVRAAGPFELEIDLDRPTAHFLKLLTLPAAFPIHQPSLARYGDRFARPGNFISNGAYRLADWRVGSHVQLERNEFYWDSVNTLIKRVWYYPTVDQVSELNRYRAGELDVTANVPTQAFTQLREQRPGELKVAPYLNTYYYGFNLTRMPFKDSKPLRRALSMVIDRGLLVREITRRGEQPALGWIPPGLSGYEPQRVDFADWSWEERLAVARRLYAQAGYSLAKPLRTQIRFNTDRGHQQIALAIQSMWRETLGVETELVNEELKVHLSRVRQGEETEVFRASWAGDYADPQTFAALLTSKNPANLTGYANSAYDAILTRAAASGAPVERLALLQQAERLMLDDAPLIPIYFYVSKHLVRPEVQGWRDNVLDIHLSRHLAIDGGA